MPVLHHASSPLLSKRLQNPYGHELRGRESGKMHGEKKPTLEIDISEYCPSHSSPVVSLGLIKIVSIKKQSICKRFRIVFGTRTVRA